jgi:hypothetical protein
MTPRSPKRTRQDHSAGVVQPPVPSSPMADTEGTPVAAASPARSAATGPDVAPEAAGQESGFAAPGVPRETLSDEKRAAQRKAWKAALSANAQTLRNQRAWPWKKRDPLSRKVPGVRWVPPGGQR